MNALPAPVQGLRNGGFCDTMLGVNDPASWAGLEGKELGELHYGR